MGYNTNRLDLTLADVVGTTPDVDLDDDLWLYADFDWVYDYADDPRPPYYHGIDLDADDPPIVTENLGYDPNEIILPFTGKVSMTAALGYRMDKACPYGCCRDRRLRHRRPKFNDKPKRKDHRQ